MRQCTQGLLVNCLNSVWALGIRWAQPFLLFCQRDIRSEVWVPPNREIDFGFGCDCVACVRASERSCVRGTIFQWQGLAVLICGVRLRRLSSRRMSKLKVLLNSDRRIVIALSQ